MSLIKYINFYLLITRKKKLEYDIKMNIILFEYYYTYKLLPKVHEYIFRF